MNDKLALDPKTSALLVMDFQTAIVEMIAAGSDALLARTTRVIDTARSAKMRIIYVVVAFRPGYPEVSPRHPSFGPIRETGRFIEGSPGTEVHAAVAPKPGDVIVTNLEVILRAGGIETLVLTGIATSGVVLSTVRYASDADYRLVVVEDCCADRDPEVHRVLTEKVFARATTVVKAEGVVEALA
jgi:nicotinamidase-related amidase